jgi:hypothetical protein
MSELTYVSVMQANGGVWIVCHECAADHWRPGDRIVGQVDAEAAGGCRWHRHGRPAIWQDQEATR